MSKLLIAFGLVILLVITPSYQSKGKMGEERKSRSISRKKSGDCTKGKFIETDGVKKKCENHADCYDHREPIAWCRPTRNQSWIEKGCFCDRKKHLCVIERMNSGTVEYAYCAPSATWNCP
ncbi:unnamed protein product [Cercopithifilaria johnstoni]|uniref:Uncharacterized protein n=1 Tax=Cercopithifilaria johnstoni TaxID=2874296 RepID=A0A8J2M4L0_9BILA|nr:unnamed protein product [Cercopithifilaria johnstoni]